MASRVEQGSVKAPLPGSSSTSVTNTSKSKLPLGPKPCLAPKPFSLQKNASIRSIQAPKTHTTSLKSAAQAGKSDATGVPKAAVTTPAPPQTKQDPESKPSSVKVLTEDQPKTIKEIKTSPHEKQSLGVSVLPGKLEPVSKQTAPPKSQQSTQTPQTEQVHKEPVSQTNHKAPEELGTPSEENNTSKKDVTPTRRASSKLPWGGTRKRLSMELTSKFESSTPPVPPQPSTTTPKDNDKKAVPEPSLTTPEPVNRGNDENEPKEDYSGGGSIKNRISLLFDSSSKTDATTKREEPEIINHLNDTGGVKERIKNWTLESNAETQKVEKKPQVPPRPLSKSLESADSPTEGKVTKKSPGDVPVTRPSSTYSVDTPSADSTTEQPSKVQLDTSRKLLTDDKSKTPASHEQRESTDQDQQHNSPATAQAVVNEDVVPSQNVKRRSIRFGVVERDDGGPPEILDPEPESNLEDERVPKDDSEDQTPVSFPVYKRAGSLQKKDDEIQREKEQKHLEFARKRKEEESERARLELEEKQKEEMRKIEEKKLRQEERERQIEEETKRSEERQRERLLEVQRQGEQEEKRAKVKTIEEMLRQDQEGREKPRWRDQEQVRWREEREARLIPDGEEHRIEGIMGEQEMNGENKREKEWEVEGLKKVEGEREMLGEVETTKEDIGAMWQRRRDEETTNQRQEEEKQRMRLREEEEMKEKLREKEEERRSLERKMDQEKEQVRQEEERRQMEEERQRQLAMERQRLKEEAEEKEKERLKKAEMREKLREEEERRRIEFERKIQQEKEEMERVRQEEIRRQMEEERQMEMERQRLKEEAEEKERERLKQAEMDKRKAEEERKIQQEKEEMERIRQEEMRRQMEEERQRQMEMERQKLKEEAEEKERERLKEVEMREKLLEEEEERRKREFERKMQQEKEEMERLRQEETMRQMEEERQRQMEKERKEVQEEPKRKPTEKEEEMFSDWRNWRQEEEREKVEEKGGQEEQDVKDEYPGQNTLDENQSSGENRAGGTGPNLISFDAEDVPYWSRSPNPPSAQTPLVYVPENVVYEDFSVKGSLLDVPFDDFSVKPQDWSSQPKVEPTPVHRWQFSHAEEEPDVLVSLDVDPEEHQGGEQADKRDTLEDFSFWESPKEETLINMDKDEQKQEVEVKTEEEECKGESKEEVKSYSSDVEDKDTDALIDFETDQQHGVEETTPESDSPKAILDQVPEVSSEDSPTEIIELPPFPEISIPRLDNQVQKSKAELGKRRTRPTRRPRAGLMQTGSQDWRTCDSTEDREEPLNQRDSDEEDQPKSKVVCSPPTTQRVPMIPGLSPAALLAQLKKRTPEGAEETGEERGRDEKHSPNEEVSPSQFSRSPRPASRLAGAARVLPPLGGTGVVSSPAWLKELKSKKRLSQHDSET